LVRETNALVNKKKIGGGHRPTCRECHRLRNRGSSRGFCKVMPDYMTTNDGRPKKIRQKVCKGQGPQKIVKVLNTEKGRFVTGHPNFGPKLCCNLSRPGGSPGAMPRGELNRRDLDIYSTQLMKRRPGVGFSIPTPDSLKTARIPGGVALASLPRVLSASGKQLCSYPRKKTNPQEKTMEHRLPRNVYGTGLIKKSSNRRWEKEGEKQQTNGSVVHRQSAGKPGRRVRGRGG